MSDHYDDVDGEKEELGFNDLVYHVPWWNPHGQA